MDFDFEKLTQRAREVGQSVKERAGEVSQSIRERATERAAELASEMAGRRPESTPEVIPSTPTPRVHVGKVLRIGRRFRNKADANFAVDQLVLLVISGLQSPVKVLETDDTCLLEVGDQVEVHFAADGKGDAQVRNLMLETQLAAQRG